MKIEKLTENKIRVIILSEELGEQDINVHSFMSKAIETQDVFSNILKRAEKEVDFCTDGCKLLIEAFSSSEDVFVFTITKYNTDQEVKKKKLVAKRKSFNMSRSHAICQFSSFDVFCDFCLAIKFLPNFSSSKLAKNVSLYEWKGAYYLTLRNVDLEYQNSDLFFSTLTEFGKLLSFSEVFEFKLLEHGKVLIKKNAIDVGINFFTK